MKLLTRCMYALLFMGFSMTLNASVEPTISIRSQKGQSFSLHLKGMNNETYNVLLRDKNGYVLLKEKVKGQDDYLKFYNLKNLPAGEYQLSIENNQKIVQQNIKIRNQKVAIDPAEKKEIQKPLNNKAQNKSANKKKVASDQQHPLDDAVMNKIKWLNSGNN